MVHYNITVHGKVQGVFFRASAKEKALDLGVKGIIRNELDGRVYIEAEGEEEVVKEFIVWCRQGPRYASVTQVDVQADTVKHYSTFEILR